VRYCTAFVALAGGNRDLQSDADQRAIDYIKSHGRRVADVMTREVIPVNETTELADIVTLLKTKRIITLT
jgi:predicted transcriptional regulator